MSPALANFLFEAANFLLLAAVLGWVLFKPVRRALDAERERHEEERRESERLRAEAESLAEEARKSHENAEHEIEEQRKELLAAARTEAAGIVEEARKRAGAERESLGEELSAMREAQVGALAERLGEVTAEAVRGLLGELRGPSLDRALVEAACTQLEGMPSSARSGAMVESAQPLDAQARGMLQRVLGGPVTERVVPELGAGVRVTGPGGQVDATAASIARKAGEVVAGLEPDDQNPSRAEATHG